MLLIRLLPPKSGITQESKDDPLKPFPVHFYYACYAK
jgi:hypothetical protein